MNTTWFDPQYAWLPGTLLGVLGGMYGGLVGTLMSRSRIERRSIGMVTIRTAYWILLSCSAVMLVSGILALNAGQPYGIWYGLGFAGFLGVVIFGAQSFVIFRIPKQMEQGWKSQGEQDAPSNR